MSCRCHHPRQVGAFDECSNGVRGSSRGTDVSPLVVQETLQLVQERFQRAGFVPPAGADVVYGVAAGTQVYTCPDGDPLRVGPRSSSAVNGYFPEHRELGRSGLPRTSREQSTTNGDDVQ